MQWCLKMEEGDQEPRNADSLYKVKKVRKYILLRTYKKEQSSANILILDLQDQDLHFWPIKL